MSRSTTGTLHQALADVLALASMLYAQILAVAPSNAMQRAMNIGQASEASGVSQRMIRHYEKIGLIPAPRRRDSGYRDYSSADVSTLNFVAHARDLGFPIEEIRSLLGLWQDRHRSSADVKALALARAEELGRKAVALETMRATLLDLAASCHGDARPDCPIIDRLTDR